MQFQCYGKTISYPPEKAGFSSVSVLPKTVVFGFDAKTVTGLRHTHISTVT